MIHELRLIVDMLAFAIDHHRTPATIILIAGDRDYAYAMSTLRLRKYTVVLIVPPAQNISQSLESQASVVIDWNHAILGKRPDTDTPPVRQPYRELGEEIFEQLAREIRDLNEDPAVTLNSSSHLTSTAPAHTRRVSAAGVLQPSVSQRNTDSSNAAQPAPPCTPKKAANLFPETPGVGSVASHARSATALSSHSDSSDDIQPAPTCMAQRAASVSPETPGCSRVLSGVSRARSTTRPTQAVPDIDRDPFIKNNALYGSVADECVDTINEIQGAAHTPFAGPPITNSRPGHYQNIAEPSSPPIVNYPPSPSPSATFNLGLRTAPLPSPSYTRTISGCTPLSYGNPPQRTASPTTSPIPTGGRIDATTPLKPTNTGSVSAIMDDSKIPSDRAALMDAFGLDDEDTNNNSDGIASVSTSPLLTEVDDPSHTYVVNPADVYLNKRRTSFDDTLKSPPVNNTSPPISEPPGTPTSWKSALSHSCSDSNVTMPNIEVGATSVVSDNSDNHSSGSQALPIESVEDEIRHLTPPRFLPLVNQLLLEMSKGVMKPTRSNIAMALLQHDNDVYKGVGANRFSDYAGQAERASIVELGGCESHGEPAWITLHPKWFKTNSPTPSIAPRNDSPVPQANIKTPASSRASSPLPCIAPQATPNPRTPPLPAVSDKPIPRCFQPLITRLANVQKGGMTKPLRSTIGGILGATVFAGAGVASMNDYLALAVDAGVVECGGANDYEWVRLRPDVFSGERSC
jgi:hypothetical protein